MFNIILPVYYSPATGNICGRCIGTMEALIKDGTLQRAVAYEAVAKFLVFPCSNDEHGCNEKLNYLQMADHEKQCKFASNKCPFNLQFETTSMKCSWQGTRKNLSEHLHNQHKEFLQIDLPNFVLNVYVSYVKLFFTIVDNVTFLIITQYFRSTNKFYCMVVCCDKAIDHGLYCYQLEIGKSSNDYFLVLRKPETEPFSDVQEIVNKREKMITADVAFIHTMIEEPNGLIFCKISITKNLKTAQLPKTSTAIAAQSKTKVDQQKPVALHPPPSRSKSYTDISKLKLSEPPQEDKVSGNSFLDELECPVCNNYMMPPIFVCPTGHSICNSCKIKIQNCPLCRSVLQSTRNFTLEKLASTVKYPCKYQDLGCMMTLNHEQVGNHHAICSYGKRRCPMKFFALCDVNNTFSDLIGHLNEKHTHYIVKTNFMYSREIVGNVTTSYWITIFENEIFVICCEHSKTTGPIKFNVLHVGMKNPKSTYKFELKFGDQSINNLKLIISRLCPVLPPNPNLIFKKSVMIPQDLLEPFIVKVPAPKIFFKVNIQRI
ncbi:hypothetical protein FQR65_LT10311 [Abscondita terminalis]|nr:hypothetical protein FQR65_LT10311 [Abscondita terminalis]